MLNHKQISWWSKFSPQKKLNIIHGSAASILIGGFFGVLAVISQPQGDDKKEPEVVMTVKKGEVASAPPVKTQTQVTESIYDPKAVFDMREEPKGYEKKLQKKSNIQDPTHSQKIKGEEKFKELEDDTRKDPDKGTSATAHRKTEKEKGSGGTDANGKEEEKKTIQKFTGIKGRDEKDKPAIDDQRGGR
jgi:hypothetical protein